MGKATGLGAEAAPQTLGRRANFAGKRLLRGARAMLPALLFGLRMWGSVCLALYVAFQLQLENAYWAGVTAAIVCQPSLGASLRKAAFRMVGTVAGAVFIVLLSALFQEDRAIYLCGLALWAAGCAFVATTLRNFAAYAAALAGFSAVIIAVDDLGATGGPGGAAFTFAIARASEICIGILCAGLVLIATDFGGARRRLAAQLATLTAETTRELMVALQTPGSEQAKSRPVRHGFIRRVIALDAVIDESIGESSDLRYRALTLQAAMEGLLAAISGWRIIANHLERSPHDEVRRDAASVLQQILQDSQLRAELQSQSSWIEEPTRLRHEYLTVMRAVLRLSVTTPSLRLLADATAEAMLGLERAINGVAILVDDRNAISLQRTSLPFHVPDWLVPLTDAGRVFVTVVVAELLWILTGWPSGGLALIFATAPVILFSPQADEAYALTMSFLLGNFLSAILAALVKFAVLPRVDTFTGFCLAIGLVLVPNGALIMQPWQRGIFIAVSFSFVAMLEPANLMSYDTQEFYNSALAIVTGACIAALSFRVLPPLPPLLRSRRLISLSVRELRRLATMPTPMETTDWESRVYSRVASMPKEAGPAQGAELVAALATGAAILRLRRFAARSRLGNDVESALEALSQGDGERAIKYLAQADRTLAAAATAGAPTPSTLRARANMLVISETLTQYSFAD
ncbi:MAG TPA: FUSC family protein [Xanthobacteraceae bacterium]|jgi:uncharacterized membrane protein YccC|nr:FUSC family protein [Xanthobacteraceae bacterium]